MDSGAILEPAQLERYADAITKSVAFYFYVVAKRRDVMTRLSHVRSSVGARNRLRAHCVVTHSSLKLGVRRHLGGTAVADQHG